MNYYNYWKPRRLGAYTRRVHRGEQLRVFNGVGMLAPSPQTCWYILCWKSCWLTPWCLAVIGLQIRMMNLASGSKPLLYVIFWISQDLSTICILQYDTRITIYAAVVCHYIIYTIVCLYVWSCFLQFHPTKTSRCGASNFISLTTTWRWCVPCWHWKASLWRPTVTWRKFCRPCRTLPSWVAGGSTMFFQNMHRRPCMTCVFFTACQLYSLFFC